MQFKRTIDCISQKLENCISQESERRQNLQKSADSKINMSATSIEEHTASRKRPVECLASEVRHELLQAMFDIVWTTCHNKKIKSLTKLIEQFPMTVEADLARLINQLPFQVRKLYENRTSPARVDDHLFERVVSLIDRYSVSDEPSNKRARLTKPLIKPRNLAASMLEELANSKVPPAAEVCSVQIKSNLAKMNVS